MHRLDEDSAPDQVATQEQPAERISEQHRISEQQCVSEQQGRGQDEGAHEVQIQNKDANSYGKGTAAETGEGVQTPVQGTGEAPSPFMLDRHDQLDVDGYVSEHAFTAHVASCT